MTEPNATFYKHWLISRTDREPFTQKDFNVLLPLLSENPHLNSLPLYVRKGFQCIELKDRAELDRLYRLNLDGYKLYEWAEVFVSAKPKGENDGEA